MRFLLLCTILLSCCSVLYCTKVKGSISYNQDQDGDFIFFLSRFGVGKGHEFYAYGTLERNPEDLIGLDSLMTLAFLPQGLWDRFYSEMTINRGDKCDYLISTVLNDSILMGDSRCAINGTKDNLRVVPCDHPNGNYQMCNQPDDIEPIPSSDITFHIPSAPETEYYYMFLLTCKRNFTADRTCTWGDTDKLRMTYDIKIVNNRPNETNRYTSEFPYDLQGTLTIQLVFSILYLLLVIVHFILHSPLCVKVRFKTHLLIRIFSLSIVLESVYVLLELLHYSVYASNGVGVVAFKYIGEVANQFSDWLLILVVILVGKGWQVTTSSLRWSRVTVAIWGMYIFFSGVYFIWMIIKEQVFPMSLSLYHSYQSWAGGLYLAYRMFILIYLLYEMRQVYQIENRPTALALYVILAICYIIWFCYLPLLTLFALLANPLRRLLVMSSVYLIFDFLINFGMVVLFCPKWENRFFQFGSYINALADSQYMYKNLKSYGGSAAPI